jgi:hypothetical protein
MSNSRTVLMRAAFGLLVMGSLLVQSLAFFRVELHEEARRRAIRPDRALSAEEIRAQYRAFRLFMPLEWLTVMIGPIAIPIAMLTVKALRRRQQKSELVVMAGALAAGSGAFVAFLVPPLALLWMLEAIEQRWFSRPLLLILTNGFLQGGVISMLMVTRADRAANPERHQV